MAASAYAHFNEEKGEYGYWVNEGRTWVRSPESHSDAWQVV